MITKRNMSERCFSNRDIENLTERTRSGWGDRIHENMEQNTAFVSAMSRSYRFAGSYPSLLILEDTIEKPRACFTKGCT